MAVVSTDFAEVVAGCADLGLELERAHPRPDRLHLDLREAGRRVIGQWLPDGAAAARTADVTQAVAPGMVERRGEHLVLQHGGADARLVSLARLVAGGAELVVHRPERRAVVRGKSAAGPVWTKAVRPRRAGEVVRRMQVAADVPGLRAPVVTGWDEECGTITLSHLPGRTLHDLLHGPVVDGPAADVAESVGEALGVAVGESVRRLHDAGEVDGVAGHDLGAEVDATRGLLDLARHHRALTVGRLEALHQDAARAAAVVVGAGWVGRRSLLHRDLHDKQLLVDVGADGALDVGMLDVDTLGLGDPALDLGNLLAHLDLRVEQGWTDRGSARDVEAGVLAGYRPDERTTQAAAGYRALTRARLRALYAFRPADLPTGW